MTDKTHVLRGDKLVLKNTYITKDITISHDSSNCSLIFDGNVIFTKTPTNTEVKIGNHTITENEEGYLIFKKGDVTILTLKG